MPETTFEAILATQLRTYAQGGVRPIDRYAIADSTIATGSKRRRFGFRAPVGPVPRTTLRLGLVLLLALLIAAAAFTFGAGRRAVTPPVPVPTPVPSSAVDLGGKADQAIFLREVADRPGAMDVIAVNAAGEERLIRRLDASLLRVNEVFRPYGAAARDGWLSVDVSADTTGLPGTWALVSLADPERAPRFVQYTRVIGGSWSGTGWFATVTPGTNSGFSIDVVDALAGVTRTLGSTNLPGGGPDLFWAADGSGIVTVQTNDSDQNIYGIRPRDGSAIRPGLPALADRTGSRWLAQGGRYLDTCTTPDCPIDRVSVWDADGGNVSWYAGQLAPDKLLDASFSEDGSAIWLLLDRVENGRHVAVVARADAPGEIDAGIGTVDLGPDINHMWFAGLSGDGGSQVAVSSWVGPPDGDVVSGPTAIVPRTPNSGPSLHAGSFVGFVPGALADTWPGEGAFQSVPDAPIPTAPAPATPQPSTLP